mmetsp:Transcript_22882/g.20112  ORF Transcript_22882/g.20112 Transcript_22882/m.20112 type:complete len:98 (+) Transcript_22882:112-405(+)
MSSNTNDKIAEVQAEVDKAKDTVHQSINLVIDRGDKMEDIEKKSREMQEQASLFNNNARKTRRHFCLQKWKMFALIAFIIVLLILVIWLIADPPGGK